MRSPIEDYKFLKSVNNIGDQAYFTLFEKYMKYKLKGEEKLVEIDSTDQESLIIKKNGGFPVPGFIYTFIYGGKDVIIQNSNPLKKNKSYTDLVPIVFCMGNDKNSFSGINMNALPAAVRLKFLQSFYKIYEDFLKNDAELLAQYNKLATNKKFISYIKSGKGQEMIRVFNKTNKENYNFGFRKYLIEKVDNLRMIEYSEWKFIPFYEPKDAFRKLNQSQIYKLYGRSK